MDGGQWRSLQNHALLCPIIRLQNGMTSSKQEVELPLGTSICPGVKAAHFYVRVKLTPSGNGGPSSPPGSGIRS